MWYRYHPVVKKTGPFSQIAQWIASSLPHAVPGRDYFHLAPQPRLQITLPEVQRST